MTILPRCALRFAEWASCPTTSDCSFNVMHFSSIHCEMPYKAGRGRLSFPAGWLNTCRVTGVVRKGGLRREGDKENTLSPGLDTQGFLREKNLTTRDAGPMACVGALLLQPLGCRPNAPGELVLGGPGTQVGASGAPGPGLQRHLALAMWGWGCTRGGGKKWGRAKGPMSPGEPCLTHPGVLTVFLCDNCPIYTWPHTWKTTTQTSSQRYKYV